MDGLLTKLRLKVICKITKIYILFKSLLFVDDLQELARKEMLELIERLLLEADLDSEISKLDVYGKNIDGLKDFLKHLLLDPNTGNTTTDFWNILKHKISFIF